MSGVCLFREEGVGGDKKKMTHVSSGELGQEVGHFRLERLDSGKAACLCLVVDT